MIPIIQQAIAIGYTTAQILNYLSNKISGLDKGINTARQRGYSDDDILGFLKNKIPMNKPDAAKKYSGELGDYLSANGIDTREERVQKRNQRIKTAIGTTATVIGAYRAYQNYSGIASGLMNYFGGVGAEPGGQPPQGPGGPNPMGGAPTNPEAGPQIGAPGQPPQGPAPIAPGPQGPTPITQQQVDTSSELNPAFDFLKNNNLLPKIQTMAKAGKSREEIVGFIKKKLPMMQQEQLRYIGHQQGHTGSLEETLGQMVDKSFPGLQSLAPPMQTTQEVNEQEVAPYKAKKGSPVLTKNGNLAEVVGTSGENVLVDSDGKKEKYKQDEIIHPPLPEKDLADLYDDVFKGIEKKSGQEVSRNVFMAGYSPKYNELIYWPHTGGTYVYDNVAKEDVAYLTSLLAKRKTSGENHIGAWEEGTSSPIGAAISELILRYQKERGGKGNEYIRKYDIIYDALELAKKAKKEKYAKRKKAKKPGTD